MIEAIVEGFVAEVEDETMDRIETRPARPRIPAPFETRAKTGADPRSRAKGIRSRGPGVEKSRARELRRAGGLASARDRRRLRERNAAERARVEKMMASAPMPLDPDSGDAECGRGRGFAGLRSVPAPCCPVCGGNDLHFDEVMHAGALRLARCSRCDFRWTERPRSRWAELGARMSRARGSARANESTPATAIRAEPSLRLVSDPDSDPEMLLDLPF
jgi:hypothetical protein